MPPLSTILAQIDSAGSERAGKKTSVVRLKIAGGRRYDRASGDPDALAASAGVDLSIYSLARCVSSEFGSGPPRAMLCIAEAIRNHAASKGSSIFHALTVDKRAQANHVFGEQSGRFASTLRDPRARHIVTARAAIIDGTSLAQGAVKFFDPRVQDAGFQRDRKLKRDAVQIVNYWAGRHEWVGPIPGINAYNLMLFRRVNKRANVEPALREILRGRNGQLDEDGNEKEFPWATIITSLATALSMAGVVANSKG